MRRAASSLLIGFFTVVVCSAWTTSSLSGLGGDARIIDFTVLETGDFAGYPLLLSEHDDMAKLIWISNPAAPVTIGAFACSVNDFSDREHRMIVDPAGNPIVVGLSEGRCNLYRYTSGGWLPARSIPITGSFPCMRFASAGELVMDYCFGFDLRRCHIDLDSWEFRDERVAEGWYTIKPGDPDTFTMTRWFIPCTPSIFVVAESSSVGGNSSEYRKISVVPESEFEYTIENEISGTLACADWPDDNNWVVGWRFHDQTLRVKSADSAMIDLGPADRITVDARADGNKLIVWTDQEANRTKLSRFRDHAWSSPEIILNDSPLSIQITSSESNIWILYEEYPGWKLLTDLPPPSTPTPIPDPSPTITPGPETVHVELLISNYRISTGYTFECSLLSYYPRVQTLHDHPIYVILEIAGNYYFGPEFLPEPSNYIDEMPEILYGYRSYSIIPPFTWPSGCGTMTGIHLIAAVTTPELTALVSNLDIIEFGWYAN